MNAHEEDEIKKEFQLERVIVFSDAIFSIIITIMVLDVKLPEVNKNATEKELFDLFLHIIPRMTAYIVSFIIIGRLWMKHLRIFSFLKDFNRQLITLNLLFLFSISLFPFALSFTLISPQYMRYPWGIYTYIGIIYFTYLTQTLLIAYLIRNKHELCVQTHVVESALRWKIRKIGAFATPVIILLMIAASVFHFSAYFVYGAIAVYQVILKRLKRRYYPHYKQEAVTLMSFFKRNLHDGSSQRVTNRL